MALWGKAGAMIDGMYTLTTDDLTCKSIIHCMFSVYKQQCGYVNRSMVS